MRQLSTKTELAAAMGWHALRQRMGRGVHHRAASVVDDAGFPWNRRGELLLLVPFDGEDDGQVAPAPRAPAPMSEEGHYARPSQPGRSITRPDPGIERALASALARLRALTEERRQLTNPRS